MYHLSYHRRLYRRGGLDSVAAPLPSAVRWRKLLLILLMLLALAVLLALMPEPADAQSRSNITPSVMLLATPRPPAVAPRATRLPRLPAPPAPDLTTRERYPAPDPKTQDFARCVQRGNGLVGACRQYGPMRGATTFKPKW